MSQPNLSSFICSVADLLRGDFKQSESGKVILPFTVLRRLDCVPEGTKDAVLKELVKREAAELNPEPFLLKKSGQLFYNTSPLDMKKLMGDEDNITENLFSYVQAFSPAGDRWVIGNPTNPGENFGDRWNDEGSKKSEAFFKWIDWVREDIDELLNVATPTTLQATLVRAFGETPGKRVATNFKGTLSGNFGVPKKSIFGRVLDGSFLNASHRHPPKWQIKPGREKISIIAQAPRVCRRTCSLNLDVAS